MAEEYKVCYSVQTGTSAGNERYTWLSHNDEDQAKQEIEQVEERPVTIYWISHEPEKKPEPSIVNIATSAGDKDIDEWLERRESED
jgi:hypothetical protein